jgi:RHS repeat-associated protein
VYAVDGTRLIRRDPQAVTLYLGNQELRLNRAGGNPTVTRYYTHGDRTIAMRTGTGVLTWLASDHQATDQIAINSGTLAVTRRRQLPYGAPRGATTAWPGERGFVGGTLDRGTGLTHLGAREYDPATGRFVSVDPIMDLADPEQMNGYAYSNNSPVTYSDPSGLIRPMCPDGDCQVGRETPADSSSDSHGCGVPYVCPGDRYTGSPTNKFPLLSKYPGVAGWDGPNTCARNITLCGAVPSKPPAPAPKAKVPPPAAVEPLCDSIFNCVWEGAWRGAMATNPVTLIGQAAADLTDTNITPDYVSADLSSFLPTIPGSALGVGGAFGFSVSKHGQLTVNTPRPGIGTPNARLNPISYSGRLGWLENRDAAKDEVNGFLQGDATGLAGAVPIPGPASLTGGVVSADTNGQRAWEYGLITPRSPAVGLARSYGHLLWGGW